MGDDATAKVMMTRAGNTERYKMEITVRAVGVFVRSEVQSDNMYANLDTCLAKLERQVVKISGKTYLTCLCRVDTNTL